MDADLEKANRTAVDAAKAMIKIFDFAASVLEELAEIVAEGEEFDPNIHEAVMCVEGEEGKVCEEIQKGYKFRDRLLRPSMVKVGKEEESA